MRTVLHLLGEMICGDVTKDLSCRFLSEMEGDRRIEVGLSWNSSEVLLSFPEKIGNSLVKKVWTCLLMFFNIAYLVLNQNVYWTKCVVGKVKDSRVEEIRDSSGCEVRIYCLITMVSRLQPRIMLSSSDQVWYNYPIHEHDESKQLNLLRFHAELLHAAPCL